jgi:alcohol dehydrogenase class IV
MFSAPHGAICAALLPHVMKTNLRALRQRQPGAEPLARYETVARLLTGDAAAAADAGAEWVDRLIHELHIPGLGHYGLSSQSLDEVVDKSAKASSMKANPIALTHQELLETLQRAL